MIETRQLRCFLAVAEHLNFSRAAAQLHMTQPPLTRQIQRLEQQLGVQLFTRNNRQVALTAAGTTLQQGAQQVLAQMQRLQQRTQWVAEGKLGQLSIGFVSTANQHLLPVLVQQFRQQQPNVELQLLELTGDEQILALAEQQIDVGFMFEAVEPPLVSKPVNRERCVGVVSASHPLARAAESAEPVFCQQLLQDNFVFVPRIRSPALYDTIMAYVQAQGVRPGITQQARQMQTVIGLVAAGVGVSIVPESMTRTARQDVCYLPLQPQPPELITALVCDSNNPSAVLPLFLDTVDQYLAKLTSPP